jgi:ubiquitin-conjugating enzyme E2 H
MLMRDPKGYNKKVEEYVSRFASPEDADEAGDDGDDTDDEAVISNGQAKAKAKDQDEEEDDVMSDMGEMSDDEAAGDMEL